MGLHQELFDDDGHVEDNVQRLLPEEHCLHQSRNCLHSKEAGNHNQSREHLLLMAARSQSVHSSLNPNFLRDGYPKTTLEKDSTEAARLIETAA